MIMRASLLLPLLAFLATPAFAADECTAKDASLPQALSGWTAPVQAAGDHLTPGTAATLTLTQGDGSGWATPPERAPAAGTFAGAGEIDIPAAGTWRVALDIGAWIDVVKDGKRIASTAHGHGPACSTIRKMVDFPLTAGKHMVQISNAKDAAAKLMVVAK